MTQINTDLIPEINQSLEMSLPVTISIEELKQKLSIHINYLINHDFEKLVFYLYRIDVNESKMRQLLEKQEGEDAGGFIAGLIIERQLQKIESRKKSATDTHISDDERW